MTTARRKARAGVERPHGLPSRSCGPSASTSPRTPRNRRRHCRLGHRRTGARRRNRGRRGRLARHRRARRRRSGCSRLPAWMARTVRGVLLAHRETATSPSRRAWPGSPGGGPCRDAGVRPLSVAADRIAAVAMLGAGLLSALAASGRPVDRNRQRRARRDLSRRNAQDVGPAAPGLQGHGQHPRARAARRRAPRNRARARPRPRRGSVPPVRRRPPPAPRDQPQQPR